MHHADDIWFRKSTFRSIDINIRKEDKGRDQIIKICKCLALVYDVRQSKGTLYLYLNVWLLIKHLRLLLLH